MIGVLFVAFAHVEEYGFVVEGFDLGWVQFVDLVFDLVDDFCFGWAHVIGVFRKADRVSNTSGRIAFLWGCYLVCDGADQGDCF